MKRVVTPLKVACMLLLVGALSACSSTPAPEAPTITAPQPASSIKPGSAEDFRVNVGDTVFFDVDQHTVRADAQSVLQKQAAWLQKYPTVKLMIEGHCDERGTREYNFALGERRANAAKQYLVAQGIPATRITTISFGKENPDPPGSDEGAWARNRRDVTVLQ